jgi:hydrogenase-4 component F
MNSSDILILFMAIPLAGSVILALAGTRRLAPELNIACSAAAFGASVCLAVEYCAKGPMISLGHFFFVDAFNVYLSVLTAFVAMTTAVFSRKYMRHERERGHVGLAAMRYYHAMYQLFIFSMLLALMSNNIGILWIATELATLATVLLVSLYRTPTAIEAAWKYFILCGVGIALALFGTVLVYFAAEKVLGPGGEALLWTNLDDVSDKLEPTILSLAFVFLMVGYGTKVGLAPLHNWLPDAHSEGPTPISALLSGLLLNIALYSLVRFKTLVDGSTGAAFAGNMMMAFGIISILVAGFSILRQRDIKRMFAYSSIEHMGIATFGFGLGGPLGTFAALLHLLVHSLTKSAVFFTAGHAVLMNGSQDMGRIRGLFKGDPVVGWSLMLGVLALAGMPPFGIFTSEFLILAAAVQQAPLCAPFLALGLVVAFAGLIKALQPMVSGEVPDYQKPISAAHLPAIVHLALVLILGLYIPEFLDRWFNTAVEFLK